MDGKLSELTNNKKELSKAPMDNTNPNTNPNTKIEDSRIEDNSKAPLANIPTDNSSGNTTDNSTKVENNIEPLPTPLANVNVTISIEYFMYLQLKARHADRDFTTVDDRMIKELASQGDNVWRYLYAEPIKDTNLFNLWYRPTWEKSIKYKDIERASKTLVNDTQVKELHSLSRALVECGYSTKQIESINRMHTNLNSDKLPHEIDYKILQAFVKVARALKDKIADNKQYKDFLEGVVRPTATIHNTLRTKMGLPTVELEEKIVDINLM